MELLVDDGFLDAGGGVSTGQLTGDSQGKGDGSAQGLAGDDVAVDGQRQAGVGGPGGGQVGVHAGVDGGFFALQHAEGSQRGGRGADGTDLFARGSEIRADLTHGGVGFQVGHAGDAARQEDEEAEPETRKLYRSRTDRSIAGICGGLAAYFDSDPTLIRLLMLLLILFGGLSIWAYIILWIVIPEEPARKFSIHNKNR